MKKNQERLPIKAIVSNILQLPECSFSNEAHIEINSNHEISLVGNFMVMQYSNQEIKLNSKGLVIKIFGNQLLISALNPNCIAVTGNITNVEFIR